ncbi:Probable low-affinity inorganic phosphate transporter [Richelia intracellularis]|nr:Probable low-affinity inorganic phosphate transporter [Richelia intracellularis]
MANAMGTSVGSKAITLKQALIIAGVLEFTGAILFGHQVSQTLSTQITNPSLFTPQIFVMGMISVLLAGGVWLQIATYLGLPVSSSHAIVGAIAGFSWVALGVNAVNWLSIERITIAWIVTPVISAANAVLFYSQIKYWIINQSSQITQLNEWIPWLSVAVVGIFATLVLPPLTHNVTNLLGEQLGVNIPERDISIFVGAIATFGLTIYSWKMIEQGSAGAGVLREKLFSRFQLLSACFVAFAHGSNDVGNAIAPLAAIAYVNQAHTVPMAEIVIPTWILVIGGVGIVMGLAIWGKTVISTVGDRIINLQPSSAFCAEFATATTIVLASRLGLPVSTSHTLVGAVVGIGLLQNPKSIQISTLKGIAIAWLITVPVSASLSAIIFKFMEFF